MSEYTAVRGQNMYDVCLITYGTLDSLVKLANDNGITDLNDINLSGKTFTYDNSLIVNQLLHQQLNRNYGTAFTGELSSGDRVHDDSYDDAYD